MALYRNKVLDTVKQYEKDMIRFLRDLIKTPGESAKEEKVAKRIEREMKELKFDDVYIDEMGNIHGVIGKGKHLIAYDGHIDTVGVGNIENWSFDPYEGFEDEEYVGGRGASDQRGGVASMVYAGKVLMDLDLMDDFTLEVVGSVQEEDCDGIAWQYIINKLNLKPEFVVSTEATDGKIYRGQRGRMEIRIDVNGKSCHGSAPERGENAIYKMAPIILDLEKLNNNLKSDSFLGKGSLAVSEIFYTSPSRCAVADSCAISIDRRLTRGETKESAFEEIMELPSFKKAGARISLYKYNKPSWKGYVYETDCYFPTWVVEENDISCKSAVYAYKEMFGRNPIVDKWTFSTNGVSIMGMYNIPVIGFGPGSEVEAHAPNEKVKKTDLLYCSALLSVLPKYYLECLK
jgi:putative selenium metabolism hydrolase